LVSIRTCYSIIKNIQAGRSSGEVSRPFMFHTQDLDQDHTQDLDQDHTQDLDSVVEPMKESEAGLYIE
jgi:hypothetical protein